MPDFAAFISYVLLTTFTPGPNNLMSMSNAGRVGFKKGMRFAFGVPIGAAFVFVLAALFGSLLYAYMPKAEPYLIVLGAAYILWLAFSIVRDKPHKERETGLKLNSVFTGAVLQLVNPKGVLYAVSVMTTFVLPYYKSPAQIGLFILFFSVLALISVTCWALFGSVFERLFAKHKKILNWTMALLLVYCAVSLLWHLI